MVERPASSVTGYGPQPSSTSPRGRGAGALGRIVRPLDGIASFSGAISGRRANVLLFAVTLVELAILLRQAAGFGLVDWIYVSQHVLVLGVSLTRRPAVAQDQSWPTSAAVIVSYGYPYAQVIYLNYADGYVAWSGGGAVLVILSALLSLVALLSMGRLFGVRPALRGLATGGAYRLVRHPMYLSYLIADVGYLLQEWNIGTVLLVAAGWASLAWRIDAEERMLSQHAGWGCYVRRTPYRLIPGVW